MAGATSYLISDNVADDEERKTEPHRRILNVSGGCEFLLQQVAQSKNFSRVTQIKGLLALKAKRDTSS